jgi:hypothetical protein
MKQAQRIKGAEMLTCVWRAKQVTKKCPSPILYPNKRIFSGTVFNELKIL